MKILFICNSWPPHAGDLFVKPGLGAGLFWKVPMAREFAKRGHEVKVACVCDRPAYYENVEYLHYNDLNYAGDRFQDLDVVIINRRFELANFIKDAKIKAKKVFYYGVDRWGIEGGAWVPYVEYFDRIINCGDLITNIYRATSPSHAEKFISIPIGVNPHAFYPTGLNQPTACVHSGCLGSPRGTIEAIQIYRQAKAILNQPLSMSIIGSSKLWEDIPRPGAQTFGPNGVVEDPSYANQLADAADGETQFLGRRSNYEISDILRNQGIMIHPATYETWGLSTLEAQASGVVPVVLNAMAAGEHIENGITGFICNTHEEMTNTVVELIRDPNLFHRISADAVDMVNAKYTLQLMADQWEYLF